MCVEGAEVVGYGVLVREDQNRSSSELGEDLADDNFHSRRKDVFNPPAEKSGERANPFEQIGQEYAIISHAAHQRTDLFEVLGHWPFHQNRTVVRIWAYTQGGNGVVQTICVRAAEASLRGEEQEVVFAQGFEQSSYRIDLGRRIRAENDHIIEVGRHLCQARPLMTSLITLMNQPGEALLPRGVTSHSQRPVGVLNAVRGAVPLFVVIWWNEETKSKRENTRPFPSESRA